MNKTCFFYYGWKRGQKVDWPSVRQESHSFSAFFISNIKHWKCTVRTKQLCPPHIKLWNWETFTITNFHIFKIPTFSQFYTFTMILSFVHVHPLKLYNSQSLWRNTMNSFSCCLMPKSRIGWWWNCHSEAKPKVPSDVQICWRWSWMWDTTCNF